MRAALVLVVLSLAMLGRPAMADVTLNGPLSQGGIAFGTAPPGTVLTLDGLPVTVSEQGRFVFGFHRDAPTTATLTITEPGEETEVRTLAIAPRDYAIQLIEGLPPKMVTPPEEVLARIRRDIEEVKAARAVDRDTADYASGFIWPTHGIITGVYGSQRVLNGEPRRPHYGIDIAAPTGTPIVAPADGVITLAATDHYYTGGTVILDHGQGLSSTFIHLHTVAVTVGERVIQGQEIATVGAGGRATGPHLDWRMNWRGRRLDPAYVVPPMPAK